MLTLSLLSPSCTKCASIQLLKEHWALQALKPSAGTYLWIFPLSLTLSWRGSHKLSSSRHQLIDRRWVLQAQQVFFPKRWWSQKSLGDTFAINEKKTFDSLTQISSFHLTFQWILSFSLLFHLRSPLWPLCCCRGAENSCSSEFMDAKLSPWARLQTETASSVGVESCGRMEARTPRRCSVKFNQAKIYYIVEWLAAFILETQYLGNER